MRFLFPVIGSAEELTYNALVVCSFRRSVDVVDDVTKAACTRALAPFIQQAP